MLNTVCLGLENNEKPQDDCCLQLVGWFGCTIILLAVYFNIFDYITHKYCTKKCNTL